MLKTLNLAISAACVLVSAAAGAVTLNEGLAERSGLNESFFSRHAEGWFWYQDPAEAEPVVIEPLLLEPMPAEAPKPELEAEPQKPTLQPFTLKWVRESLDRYMEEAWNNPTPENVKAYFLLQRFAVDRSTRFAEVARQVTTGNLMLDETLRRPLANYATQMLDKASAQGTDRILKKVAQSTGIFFFFKSNCPYCEAEAPLVKLLEKVGFKVIAVSVDGGRLQSTSFEDTRLDSGQAQKLGVTATPTIFLMDETGRFETIAVSAVSLSELKTRILIAAARSGLITEEEFRETQPLNQQPPQTDLSRELPRLLKAATENPATLWGTDEEMKTLDKLAGKDLSPLMDADGYIPAEKLLSLFGGSAATTHRLTPLVGQEQKGAPPPARQINRMVVFEE